MAGTSGVQPQRRTARSPAGVIAVALILILLLVPATATAQGPTVIVSNYTVTPAVLMPGDEGTITVVLSSTAPATAGSPLAIQLDSGAGGMNATQPAMENAYIQSVLLNGEGVEVLTGSFQDLGEIGPGQSFPVTFLIRAPGEEGIYFPEVWVSVRDGTSVRYPVPVNVNSAYALARKPALRVERTVPDSVDPGDPFNVTLTIQNEGQASAGDVSIRINTSSDAITLGGSENYYIPELRPGESSILNLTFETDITYRNAELATFRQAATIGVPIVGRAEMGIASIRTEPVRITAGSPVDVTFRLENTGTADAKSVRATIGDIALPGTKEAFLGTIEPGNDAPAVFALDADRAGAFDYTLTIEYADDYGVHTTRQALQMVVADRDPVPALAVAAAVLIIVALALIYWHRRRKEE
jgi:hypothetical protein